MVFIAASVRRGKETPGNRAFHHGGIIFIRREDILRSLLEGIFDHLEQRFCLRLIIDNPIGIENLVAAVLRVGLREHIKLNVIRVTLQASKASQQVINFFIGQRQP